jgi:FMN phosphatase YigB (HAD superfamily)
MKTIKYIYFDVGSVLMLDFAETNKWEEMKQDLGFTENNGEIWERIWELHAKRVCVDFDVDQLIPILEQESTVSFPPGYSLLQDFVDRFTPNPSMWSVVEQAQQKYTLGLITDMYPRMLSVIQKHKLIPSANWHTIIDSSVVGMQKPDPRIYQLAQEKAGFSGMEIMFIDNLACNLVPARQLGWQTFLYDPTQPEQSSKQLAKQIF